MVDEFGGTAGLLTLEDVLAEVLGDVGDEFKAPADLSPENLPGGRVRLPGGMTVDDAAALLRTTWETEAQTVGGLVTAALGHLPLAGETVTLGDYEFEVERTAERAVVSRVIAKRLDHRHSSQSAPGDDHRHAPWSSSSCAAGASRMRSSWRPSLPSSARHARRSSTRPHRGSCLAKRPRHRDLLDDPNTQGPRYIASTQIGMSVASLGLGMYGELGLSVWIEHLANAYEVQRIIAVHTLASVISIALLTYLHIVLCEMVPVMLALQSGAIARRCMCSTHR